MKKIALVPVMLLALCVSAHAKGKWVGMCGELAGMEKAIPILLGMGLDEFSMTPASIPKMKKIFRMSSFEESRSLVQQLFQFSTASEIECFVRNWMAKRFPEDFIKCYPEEIKA